MGRLTSTHLSGLRNETRSPLVYGMAVSPPIEPMLAKIAEEIPQGGDFLFEPKWDGFCAIVFRDDNVFIQSRDLRPLDRYFPELHAIFLDQLPNGVVLDGAAVISTAHARAR